MRGRLSKIVVIVIAALAAIAVWSSWPAPRATVPMAQSAYVWQRAWSDRVVDAVSARVPSFDGGAVLLAAEVAFEKEGMREMEVALDHGAIARLGQPVGLALRIGPCPSKRLGERDTIDALSRLAVRVIADARNAGWNPSELQIDFDSATSRLDSYRRWIEEIRSAVAPVPVTITVLPTWMSSRSFGPLVQATAGFVLQVHSVEKAEIEGDEPSLCDTASAIRWTERAAHFGVPFLVALPTYGYLAAFDEKGALVALIAEQAAPEHLRAATVREVRSDADAMAELVAHWRRSRPQPMRGIIWYRLPVEGDSLNWPWRTLVRVMQGERAAPALSVQGEVSSDGLVEIVATNTGDADAQLPAAIAVRWRGSARLVAGDALGGLLWSRDGTGGARFTRADDAAPPRVRPGERRMLGWLRLSAGTEVEVGEPAEDAALVAQGGSRG